MNVLEYLQQGTIGVSRPEGKLPGIPFLTLVVPKSPSNKPHSQTNLKQDIHFTTIEILLKLLPNIFYGLFMVNLNLLSIGMSSFHPLGFDVVMVSLASIFPCYLSLVKTIDKLYF